MKKTHSQWERFLFAVAGMRSAWRREASFRTEAAIFAATLLYMAWRRPSLFWWVSMLGASALVFLAELVNTALENVCDALHPEHDALIGAAKDCASAAVLVANLWAFVLLLILLYHTL